MDVSKDKGDYGGLPTLAREYYGGNDVNEEYTHPSPIQDRGDNFSIEDKDFVVVYNGSIGGTYEMMLRFTEKEVHDHIRCYGIKHVRDTLKGVTREMAVEQFVTMTQQKVPAFEMLNGDVLYVSYNKEFDMISIGLAINAGPIAQHRSPYNRSVSLDASLQTMNEKLGNMEEYREELQETEYSDGMRR